MRIDNQNFEELIGQNKFGIKEEKVSAYKKNQNDPFGDFGNFVGKTNPQTKNNDFGDFDFDSFPTTTKSSSQTSAPATKSVAQNNNFDPFNIPQPKKQTNTYE